MTYYDWPEPNDVWGDVAPLFKTRRAANDARSRAADPTIPGNIFRFRVLKRGSRWALQYARPSQGEK